MGPELRERNPEALQEYFQVDKKMEHFNDLRIRTKNWSVTVAAAAIAAGFANKVPQLILVAAVSNLLFWLTDARYHWFQEAFRKRQQELENLFLLTDGKYTGPQIERSLERFTKHQSTFRNMGKEAVHLPHSILVAMAIIVFLVYPFIK